MGRTIILTVNEWALLLAAEYSGSGAEPVFIKLTDYTKGYWAEAPLSWRDLLRLHVALGQLLAQQRQREKDHGAYGRDSLRVAEEQLEDGNAV